VKPLDELSHYDLLEVRPEASAEELERAYRIACATYAPESVAFYSVYDDAEAQAIRERIEEAWRVLSDPDLRSGYDAALPADGPQVEMPLPVEIALGFGPGDGVTPVPDLEPLDEDPEAPFDGPRLRRSRLHRGIEIEHIADITKINPSYLRFIEDERFDDLPASVYVRGFVCAYARIVGLDAEQVAASYMERFNGSREPVERGRGGARR
jgi:flagellar biosynthesis protein FlhG